MIKMLGNMRKNIAFFLCIFLSILDGNILARQTDITADSLYGAGTVSGAERAKVHVGSLGGGQSVTAGEHLELNVASDVDNHGTLGAAGQADINIPNLNNHGRVLAGEVLNLSTGQLNNAAEGLINTSSATNIQASSIDNLGHLHEPPQEIRREHYL
jgi:hypothetical protein